MSYRKRNNQKNRGRHKHGQGEAGRSAASQIKEEEENVATREKNNCYEIKTSDVMGRYLEAARNIPAGELLLSVEPLVVGPCLNSPEICLGCYTDINQLSFHQRCEYCGWPLCSPKCKGLHKAHGHSKAECDFLKAVKYTACETILNVITPLRCLLLKKENPSKWNIVFSMESHNDVRKNISTIWQTNQKTIVDRIFKEWGNRDFTEDEIHTVCGVLEVNAFEVSVDEKGIRGIYPEAFLLSHDCIPNTSHYNNSQFRFEIRTTVPVRQGEILKTSYAYTLQGTMRRQKHLRESKFFQCKCERCKDPTEFGSNLSTLVCPKCNKNALLSTNPLDLSAEWKCIHEACADFSISGQKIQKWMDRLYEEAESISGDDIESYERFLKTYKDSLDSSHYLMIGVKYSLCQLYGKIQDFIIDELSTELLQRKISLCEEVLKVADKISPGISVLRGTIMYELHAPLMVLATRDFQNSNITKDQMRNQLKKIKSLLTSCFKCLQNEPLSTNEGSIGHAAKEALDSLKSWEKFLGKF